MDHGWRDDASRPDPSGPGRPVGARFHARPQADPEPAHDRGPGSIPVVLRGYERSRVDARLAELTAQLEAARAEMEDYRRRWCAARQHAAEMEVELRERRHPAPRREEGGAAPIADKVLRLARMEAAQIRAEAHREAEALLARARQQAV